MIHIYHPCRKSIADTNQALGDNPSKCKFDSTCHM